MNVIAGIISKNETDIKGIINKMSHNFTKNGDKKEWFAQNIGISGVGNQVSEITTSECQRYISILYGVIYNSKELKKEHSINNNFNDCQLFSELWKRSKQDSLKLIEGAFAAVIWDKHKQELTIVRDSFGVKQLYYAKNKDSLVFSTSIKTLLASTLISKEISSEALIDYLRYQTVQAPNTILKEITAVPPASFLTYKTDGDIEISRYWNIEPTTSNKRADIEQVKEEIKNIFQNSVKNISESNNISSSFLSGGIDSTLSASVLAELNNQPINTFNIAFAEDKFDESKYARFIAKNIGSNHTEHILSSSDFLIEIPTALKNFDHPSGDGLNSWIASKVASEQGINSIFSGIGGDEIFGGYPIFSRAKTLNKVSFLWKTPYQIRNFTAKTVESLKSGSNIDKIAELLRLKKYSIEEIFLISRQVFNNNQLQNILNPDIQLDNNLTLSTLQNSNIKISKNQTYSRITQLELISYVDNTLLRDSEQMSQPHNLSIYSPFLNKELIEYIISLPDELKSYGKPKQLLIDSFPQFLPNYIVDRPKMGFVLPWNLWLKKDLKPFVEERLSNIADWEIFDKEEVFKLWNQFLNDNTNIPFSYIWILVVLSEWKNILD